MAITGDKETKGREKTTELGDYLTAQQARIRRLNSWARGRHTKIRRENEPFEEVKHEDIYMQTRRYDTSILRAKMCELKEKKETTNGTRGCYR